jgi:hypothetical protein
MPAIADWLEAAKEKAQRREPFARRFFDSGYELLEYPPDSRLSCHICDAAPSRLYRIEGEHTTDMMSFVCEPCFSDIEDDAWRLRDPWEAGRRVGERRAAASQREQWYRVAFWIGLVGFVLLLGAVVLPQTGGAPFLAFFVGFVAYLSLIVAGVAFAIWGAIKVVKLAYGRVKLR